MKKRLTTRILSVVLVTTFLINEVSFGLSTAPGSRSPEVRNAMDAAAFEKLSAQTHCSIDFSVFEGEAPQIYGVRLVPTVPDNPPTAWSEYPILRMTDFAEALRYFIKNEAKVPEGVRIEVVKQAYEVEKNRHPFVRTQTVEHGGQTTITIMIHPDFDRVWNEILKNDVWFTYRMPDGKERILSFAWGMFNWIAKHELTDMEKKTGLPKRRGQMTASGHIVAIPGVGMAQTPDEALASFVGGNYSLPTDAIKLVVFGAFCGERSLQVNGDLFRQQIEWILDRKRQDEPYIHPETKENFGILQLYRYFPALMLNEDEKRKAIELACFLHHAYFSRPGVKAVEFRSESAEPEAASAAPAAPAVPTEAAPAPAVAVPATKQPVTIAELEEKEEWTADDVAAFAGLARIDVITDFDFSSASKWYRLTGKRYRVIIGIRDIPSANGIPTGGGTKEIVVVRLGISKYEEKIYTFYANGKVILDALKGERFINPSDNVRKTLPTDYSISFLRERWVTNDLVNAGINSICDLPFGRENPSSYTLELLLDIQWDHPDLWERMLKKLKSYYTSPIGGIAIDGSVGGVEGIAAFLRGHDDFCSSIERAEGRLILCIHRKGAKMIMRPPFALSRERTIEAARNMKGYIEEHRNAKTPDIECDFSKDDEDIRTLDGEIDRLSSNPGRDLLGKRISLRYLGPLLGLKIEQEFRRGGLFVGYQGELPSAFTDHNYENAGYKGLTGKSFMYIVDSWDRRAGLQSLQMYLQELGIENATEEDAWLVLIMAQDIMRRSAQLNAARFAGLIMAREGNDTPSKSYEYSVEKTFEGHQSFSYPAYPSYTGLMRRALADIFVAKYVLQLDTIEAAGEAVGVVTEKTSAPAAAAVAPAKGAVREMDANVPSLGAIGRGPTGTAEEMTLEHEITKAADALYLSYSSIEDAVRSSINKKKLLDDIAESVGITAAAALEIMEKTGIAVVTDRTKREYEIASVFSGKGKLEELRVALVKASSNPDMVDLATVRITRIILNSIDVENFISSVPKLPAYVIEELTAADAFPTLGAAVRLKKEKAKAKAKTAGRRLEKLNAKAFVKARAGNYYKEHGVSVEFSIPKDAKVDEGLLAELKRYQGVMAADMARGGYNYRGAGTKQTIEQFFNNYFRKEWYDRICQFVNERFSEEHPLKAIVTNGIGANDQFMWSLINMYNAKRPDGAPKWYHIPVARDLEQLRRDGIQGKEALFIDISRSGGTWEGVEVAIRSLQMGYTDHLALANGGAIKAVAEKAAKLGQYKPLIIGMSPDIGGRNMHRKTTIYYTAQTVAGMFLSWMNSNVFAEFNDAFDKANDFAEPDNSLAVSAGQFLQGTMETLDVNHIAFITNTEALRLVGTEWEQYIMEGCNKEHVISMGMHDLATEPEDVLQNFSRTRLARQTVSIVILDRSALSYETDRMRVAALAETTPLMIFTVETMFGRGINIEQQAAFDILWTDLVTVFTTLLRVDANSNPNVKFVREYTAMRVAEWRTAEGKYKDDAIGRGEAEVLVSMGNPKQPKIGSEGSQVALTKDNAANKGKEMAEALLSSGMLSDRNRLNLFVGRDDLRPITKDMREYAYSVLCPEGGAGWVTQTALFPLWSHKGLEANLAYSTDPAKPLLANKTINIFFNARSLGAGETYSQAFQSMGILGNKYDGINGATVAQTNDAMTLPNVIRMAEVSPTILLEFNDRTVSTEEVIRAFTKAFIDRLAAEQPAAAPTKGTERTMDASVPGSLGAVGLSPAGTTAAEAAKVEVKKTQSPGDLAYSAIRTALNKNKTEVEKKGGVGIGIARQVIGRALDMLDGSRTITVIIEELRRGERDLRLLQSTEGYNDRQKKEIESAAGILADSANDIGSVVKFDLTVPNLPSSPFRLSAELGENLLRRLLKGGLEGRITVYDNQNTSTMRIGLYRGSSIMLYAVNNGRTEDLFINPSDEFVVLKDGHIAYIKAGTDKIGLLFDGWPFNNIPASSVISASFLNLPEEERAAKAASAVKTGRALNQEVYVHVDVIYGNESKGTRIVQKGVKKDTYEALKPDMVKQIRNECRKLGIDDPCIDVHLMLMEDMLTADNSKLIRDYIDNGAGIVTLHWEAFESKDALLKCLRYIHSRNVKAGLALNPDVNIDEAVSFIGNNKDCIDMVLQMTVSPGLPGQVFNEKKTAEANLGRIREIFKGPIQVDGGINETTLNENPWLKTADIFVAGSAFFNDKPMDETCGRLRTALERIKSGPPSVETPAAVPAEGTVTKMDASGPGKLPAVGLSPAGTTAAQAAPAAAEPATSMAQFEFTLDRNELYRMIGSNMSLHIALSILASKLSKVWAEDDDGDMIVSICNRDIHNNSLSSDAPLDINDTTIPARAVAENVLRSSVVRLTGKSHLPIYILLTAEDVPVLYTGDWDMDVGGLKGYDVAVASGITISDVDKIIKLIPARETNVRASWVAFGERLASALVVPTTPAPAAAAPRTAAEMRAAILRILLEARDEIIQGFHYYKEKALGAISQASSQISGLVPLAEAVITLEGTASELSQTKVGTTYSTEELNDRKHFRNILIKTADKVRGLLTTDLGVTNKPSRPIWMSAEKGVALVRMLLEGGLEGRICRYGSESSSLVWVGPRRHNEKLYTVNEHAHAIKDLDIKPGDAFVVLTDGSIGFVPASTKKEGEVLVCSENNYIRYADTAQLSADGRKFIEINEASDNEIGALTAAPVAVSAPMKGIERTMDASGPGRLPAVGRSPGGTAEEMTLENRIAKAAKALDMSYASIEDAIRSSINKRKFLDDIAESVGITAAAALEIMEKTGIAVVTDRAKREYTIVSNFSRKDKLENLRLALIRASSNPAMVDLSIERITRIILDLIDMEIFISLLSSAAEISPANVVLKLAAQDAFPTLTTASAAAEPTTQAPAEHPLITAIKEAEIEDLVLPNLAGVGPGSVSLDQANRQDAYNTATMVKKSKVEVFVDGTIGLTQTMKDALKDMKQRNRNVSHEEFPTMDHLRELLEKKTEDGVQRIILLQAETSKAITQLAEQSPELFKNVRLVNMKLPDKYDTMAAREKTFVQSRMVMTAILARLYEKDKTPAVERVLKAMVDDDKLADSKGRKFFEGLEETADEATDPAKIRDRVQGCVERVISLMARIALDMERIRLMLQTIWTAA